MLPTAVDVLCEAITEVTGTAPQRDCVEFVGSFWLLHACDRVVFSELAATDSTSGEPAVPLFVPVWESTRSRRARLLSTVGARRAPIRIADPYFKSSFTSQLQAAFFGRRRIRWQPVSNPLLPQRVVQGATRSAMVKVAIGTDATPTDLRQVVALSAPSSLVESHHDLVEWAESQNDRHARILYTANAHQSSLGFRHRLFAQRSIGSKIALHQHGGGYGIDEMHLGEEHDIALSDVFYTWGWQRAELGRRVRPLPVPLPLRHRGTPTTDYLLMSLPVTSSFFRFQPFLIPRHIERCVEETVAFVNQLCSSTSLCLRSSGADGFPVDRLPDARVRVSVDDLREPGTLAASRARLVIHNYLGTSWLETLAMNVPTVCFYDPKLYAPRESARPYFDMLARVGILHHSGRAAAKFVNGLRGDPSSWWNSAEVQEAREAFVARYANFSDSWLEAWQTEFESLLSA
jgi:putative transferase (TIGR04331 family)